MPPETALTRDAGIRLPLICGAMYPCSNPELVAAASEAGGIGIIQPISLTYIHGHDFREGIRYIRSLTDAPVGMNALIEGNSKRYRARMEEWIDIALEEGVRFFITSLGKPDWVVRKVHPLGGKVYHDVTERRWAEKGIESGVDGLIGVNRRAGGHPGPHPMEALMDELGDLGLPVVCAGGIGSPESFRRALELGYAGVQMGTRFIATHECRAADAYKEAIVDADEDDILWSETLTGVPVAVLDTPTVRAMGTRAGPIARRLLRWRKTRHWMRAWYTLRAMRKLGKASLDESGRDAFWQAGRSVGEIHRIESVAEIIRSFEEALQS
jgi:nitronate monooxygenase